MGESLSAGCVDVDSNPHSDSHDRVGIYATFLRVGVRSPLVAASAKATAHGLLFRDFERRFAV